MASDALNGVLAVLRQAYGQARTAYFVFADAVLMLKDGGMSSAAIVAYLGEHFPDAQTRVGWSLNAAWVRTALTLAEQFRKDGGLVSPDGKHAVSRDDLTSLNLSQAQLGKLASHLAYSETAPKGARKLRVSDVASAVAAMAKATTAEARDKASSALLAKLDEIDSDIALRQAGDERGLLLQVASAAQAKVTKARAALAKAEEALAKAQAAVAEYDAKNQPAKPNRVTVKPARSTGQVVTSARA